MSEHSSDTPVPAGPEDPTFSPSKEGATPFGTGKKTDRPESSAASASGESSGSVSGFEKSAPSFEGRLLGGRWEVGRRIGAGGMATVHAGQDQRLGRPVACKILHPHIADSPEARERLAREARAIAQLKHENVIEVYDYAADDPECTWLITELIEGGTLRQFFERHSRPMPEIAVMIVTEVLRALGAAHAVGVIHRDVKPDNVLVGKDGRPKLSDFGIAKVLNEAKMTMTGNLVGSPSYMSPEQADGLHTDHRTDLYSAGILLYRLVTGTLPFRGSTPLETIRLVSRGDYTDPVELAPESSGAVAGIIRRALTLEIDERYQTAEEMLADLAIVLQDTGLSATWEELPKYFKDPTNYEAELRPKLAKELEVRGKALLDAGEEGRAVDCFNRALALGEGSQRTADVVQQLSRRRKRGKLRRIVWTGGVAVGAAAIIAAAVVLVDLGSGPPPSPAVAAEPEPIEPKKTPPSEPAEAEPAPAEKLAAVKAPEPEPELEPAPKTVEPEPEPEPARKRPTRRPSKPAKKKPVVEKAPAAKYGTLHVGSRVWGVDVIVDGKKLGTLPKKNTYPLPPGTYRVRAVKPDSDCLPFERTVTIRPGEKTKLKLNVICS